MFGRTTSVNTQHGTEWPVPRVTLRRCSLLGVLLFLCAILTTAYSFGQLKWLEPPPGYLASYATGVSDDGHIVAGFVWDGQQQYTACIWQNGMIRLLPTPDGAISQAYSVSSDGQVIVGTVRPMNSVPMAVYWQNDQMYILCPGTAYDVSANGETIVGEAIINAGLGQTKGFIWRGGDCYLFDLADDPVATTVFGISPDGRWAVGVYVAPNVDMRCRFTGVNRGFLMDTYTFAWVDIPSLADGRTEDEIWCLGHSYAFAVSNAMPTVTVAGTSDLGDWQRSAVAAQWFPPMQIGSHYSGEVDINSYAFDVTRNGFIKVGLHDRFGATRWVGIQEEDLNTVFAPVRPCGSSLWWADSVSTDESGRFIVGWGHNIVTGQPRAFLIDSTRVLEGDVNMDGCVNDVDLLAVIMSFGGSDPYADLNCDGVVDDADILIVISNFGDC
jgi:probable HAF family extracellular repeat protein